MDAPVTGVRFISIEGPPSRPTGNLLRVTSVLGYGQRVMLSQHRGSIVRRWRTGTGKLTAAIGGAVMIVLLLASPVAAVLAQEDTEAAETVRSIRLQLFGLAGLVAILLLVFIWYTSPRRRSGLTNRSDGSTDE